MLCEIRAWRPRCAGAGRYCALLGDVGRRPAALGSGRAGLGRHRTLGQRLRPSHGAALESSSSPGKGHKLYPYLLRNLPIAHVNQVWSADITYVPLLRGFMYLVAVIDWHSRYVLAWQLSSTLDGIFCLDALRQALSIGQPKIFNTDQGAQFTADAFTACLLAANIQVSMDGRGRALDNVFCERLWRSVKYENIYLNQYDTVRQLQTGLTAYFDFSSDFWLVVVYVRRRACGMGGDKAHAGSTDSPAWATVIGIALPAAPLRQRTYRVLGQMFTTVIACVYIKTCAFAQAM